MEMNVASEPSASWSEGGSQKWTSRGWENWRPMHYAQGLGGVFEDSKMDWKQVCEMQVM